MRFITRRRLTGVELVDAANPFQPTIRQIIEGNKIVVAWDAMDGLNTTFRESLEEVFCHVNGLLER